MYVEWMKNFLLADSNELMVVRLISASWAKKRWFLVSRHDVRRWWKIFFSPIRASWWLLDSSRPRQPKSVWFLLCRHDVLRGWWKIFISPIRASFWLLDSFWRRESKNVWFLLSRHDVRRVHERFSSRRFERAEWLLDSFRPVEPNTFDSYFLDMMYVDFMKNFLLADSSVLMAVRLISAPWAQKRLIPTF